MAQHIAVIIGVGGMGQAIARRLDPASHLLLADFDAELLESAATRLGGEGYTLTRQHVDVSDHASVTALAEKAASLGEVRTVVHTAGLSPVQAPVPAILAVDLLGVALVLEEFGKVVAEGGAGLVISSMAGHAYPAFTPEQVQALTATPADRLLSLPLTAADSFPHPGAAYSFAKKANQLHVRAASTTWGTRRARVNSISPGVISTPMGQRELAGESGAHMRAMIDSSNARRPGTPADIAAAAEFLLGPAAGFISGTDLLVDGGVTAAGTLAPRG
ncbi:SDR family oxidoreductase [Streptomyces nitrosporeus]|uniref:SDR family oxidoreductase n=1 Tax=Streptomyces nitrosporeus TaxID=28894 RepID=A0A5J6FIQ7_9ACTN|nr:SDR family oxidoreductase [Streptomyces nitrosporeus]QEU74825.1 SDR family oxidoreductase [Streptomyces nitrosporeus]GGY86032.1 short-chain dehydrogenase/reductas [Streptomyces nitrosporeus]